MSVAIQIHATAADRPRHFFGTIQQFGVNTAGQQPVRGTVGMNPINGRAVIEPLTQSFDHIAEKAGGTLFGVWIKLSRDRNLDRARGLGSWLCLGLGLHFGVRFAIRFFGGFLLRERLDQGFVAFVHLDQPCEIAEIAVEQSVLIRDFLHDTGVRSRESHAGFRRISRHH